MPSRSCIYVFIQCFGEFLHDVWVFVIEALMWTNWTHLLWVVSGHSFIPDIYIAPFQETYSLPRQGRRVPQLV